MPPAARASASSCCSCQADAIVDGVHLTDVDGALLERIELTSPTLQPEPGDNLVSALRDVARRGGVAKCLTDGVVVELESGPFQNARDGTLAAQQRLVGELTERGT